MMMASSTTMKSLLVFVLALAAVVNLSAASTHSINWSPGKFSDVTCKYGDYARFLYTHPHNLVEVTQAGYTSCRGGVIKRYSPGALIPLKKRGTSYFICQPHCTAGMKIKIKTV